MISGAVSGLVAITPAAGFVGPASAIIIGVAAGVSCLWGATTLKRIAEYDDSLDAFGVHGIVGASLSVQSGDCVLFFIIDIDEVIKTRYFQDLLDHTVGVTDFQLPHR